LADLSQIFSILSDFFIGVPSQALQIIFEMQTQTNSQNRALKKICFFELQNAVFSIFLHFDSSYFQTS
jgi:hypothetical protein